MTSYTQRAIEDAVKGGWRPSKYLDYDDAKMMNGFAGFVSFHYQQYALLDPVFWQALGKTRGWTAKCDAAFLDGFAHPSYNACKGCKKASWMLFWHRLIDHLASGGTIESFFEGLYKVTE